MAALHLASPGSSRSDPTSNRYRNSPLVTLSHNSNSLLLASDIGVNFGPRLFFSYPLMILNLSILSSDPPFILKTHCMRIHETFSIKRFLED